MGVKSSGNRISAPTGLSLREADHMSGNSTAGGYVDRGGISGDVGTQILLTHFTVSTHGGLHNSPRVRIGSSPEAYGFRKLQV